VKYLSNLFSKNTAIKVLELKETNMKENGLLDLILSIQNNRRAEKILCTLCRITLKDPGLKKKI